MRNAAAELVKDVVVFVHNDRPTNDADSKALLECIRAAGRLHGGDYSKLKRLVFSDGGGPTVAQRAELNAIFEHHRSRCAVVTVSPIARGIVTALGWFDPEIKAFRPSEWQRALAYLGIQHRATIDAIVQAVRRLGEQVGAVRVLRDVRSTQT